MSAYIKWLERQISRFGTAFLEADRWKLYLQGLGVTLEMTISALLLGVILGLIVAIIQIGRASCRERV